ncbi:MAG: hypothetical protein ACRD1T_18690, partial [Acidimicrobiia bacterium]
MDLAHLRRRNSRLGWLLLRIPRLSGGEDLRGRSAARSRAGTSVPFDDVTTYYTLLYELDREERRGEGETMSIPLGSPDFLRMFPTVVWTLQLDEEATRAINPAILRQVVEIRASAGEPSAGENWQSGHAPHRRDEFHALVEAIEATTRKVLS